MKKLLCLLLGALVSTSSMSADWVSIGSTTDSGNYYIDNSSIDNSGSNTKFWLKTVYKKVKTSKPKDEKNSTVLFELSCSSKQFRILSGFYTAFDKSTETDIVETSWRYIPPESAVEAMMQKVCN